MTEAEHTWTFRVPVPIVKTAPSGGCWTCFTGFMAVHCAWTIGVQGKHAKIATRNARRNLCDFLSFMVRLGLRVPILRRCILILQSWLQSIYDEDDYRSNAQPAGEKEFGPSWYRMRNRQCVAKTIMLTEISYFRTYLSSSFLETRTAAIPDPERVSHPGENRDYVR